MKYILKGNTKQLFKLLINNDWLLTLVRVIVLTVLATDGKSSLHMIKNKPPKSQHWFHSNFITFPLKFFFMFQEISQDTMLYLECILFYQVVSIVPIFYNYYWWVEILTILCVHVCIFSLFYDKIAIEDKAKNKVQNKFRGFEVKLTWVLILICYLILGCSSSSLNSLNLFLHL